MSHLVHRGLKSTNKGCNISSSLKIQKRFGGGGWSFPPIKPNATFFERWHMRDCYVNILYYIIIIIIIIIVCLYCLLLFL